ncbi:hypothetical protein RDI58_021001 [Solanum bulbocastanum]|uniref:Uncharacterized protein n=1 Tax=Solanum bulbocastanum TaxID=147425 RepID=A0AAN8Y8A4_SOLBU
MGLEIFRKAIIFSLITRASSSECRELKKFILAKNLVIQETLLSHMTPPAPSFLMFLSIRVWKKMATYRILALLVRDDNKDLQTLPCLLIKEIKRE